MTEILFYLSIGFGVLCGGELAEGEDERFWARASFVLAWPFFLSALLTHYLCLNIKLGPEDDE